MAIYPLERKGNARKRRQEGDAIDFGDGNCGSPDWSIPTTQIFVLEMTTCLDNRRYFGYILKIPLAKGAFREGTFGRRSGMRCPRADECDPLPGGSGAPVGRQKDRSARSVLNSRRCAANGQNPLCAVP